MQDTIFLIIGCVFPAIGWLTFISTYLYERKTGKYSSPILIPIIGPVFLNLWSLGSGHPYWAFILPWLLDICTLSLIIVIPNLLKESWQYSKFTELLSVISKLENQTVKISLHKNNHYIIRYNWSRNNNEPGIVAMNDFGTYTEANNHYVLVSHTGKTRELQKNGNEFCCTDKEVEGESNINGYTFT